MEFQKRHKVNVSFYWNLFLGKMDFDIPSKEPSRVKIQQHTACVSRCVTKTWVPLQNLAPPTLVTPRLWSSSCQASPVLPLPPSRPTCSNLLSTGRTSLSSENGVHSSWVRASFDSVWLLSLAMSFSGISHLAPSLSTSCLYLAEYHSTAHRTLWHCASDSYHLGTMLVWKVDTSAWDVNVMSNSTCI